MIKDSEMDGVDLLGKELFKISFFIGQARAYFRIVLEECELRPKVKSAIKDWLKDTKTDLKMGAIK